MNLKDFKLPKFCPACNTLTPKLEISKSQLKYNNRNPDWSFICPCKYYALYIDYNKSPNEYLFPNIYCNETYEVLFEEYYYSNNKSITDTDISIHSLFNKDIDKIFKLSRVHINEDDYFINQEFDFNDFSSQKETLDFRKKVIILT